MTIFYLFILIIKWFEKFGPENPKIGLFRWGEYLKNYVWYQLEIFQTCF